MQLVFFCLTSIMSQSSQPLPEPEDIIDTLNNYVASDIPINVSSVLDMLESVELSRSQMSQILTIAQRGSIDNDLVVAPACREIIAYIRQRLDSTK